MTRRYRTAALLLLAAALLASVPVLYSLHQARAQAIREKYVQLDDVASSIGRQVRSTIGILQELHREMRGSGEAPSGCCACSASACARSW
ncbi:MAG: hypothetical protein ACN6Q8_09600 [Stenotrophomonas sp.]